MKRLFDRFNFSRPKGPGYGISQGFYLGLFTSTAQTPPMSSIVNPDGDGGAVPGFGVPLAADAEKSWLDQPLSRGAYAVASKDRKTVLKMLVMGRDETSFDINATAAEIEGSSQEAAVRLRASWMFVQFSFESFDPAVWPAVDFLLSVVKRLGQLTEGVVADALSQKYLLPEELILPREPNEKFNIVEVVDVQTIVDGGELAAMTRGMQKFGLPEFEFTGLRPDLQEKARTLLLSVALERLNGTDIKPGNLIGKPPVSFVVAEGGLDRARWGGTPALELLPEKGDLSDAVALYGVDG